MHHLSESEPVIIVKTEKKKEKENTTLITHYELTNKSTGRKKENSMHE